MKKNINFSYKNKNESLSYVTIEVNVKNDEIPLILKKIKSAFNKSHKPNIINLSFIYEILKKAGYGGIGYSYSTEAIGDELDLT